MTLGTFTGGSGVYNLSGGSLWVGTLYLGYDNDATGAFMQTGGTNTVNDTLILGCNTGNSGAYNLSSGSLSATTEYIGNSGTGTFTQTGGLIRSPAISTSAIIPPATGLIP